MEDALAEMPRIEQQAQELLGAWRSVTLATELLLFVSVEISYILRCRKTVSRLTGPRKRLT
jgi:hypothetical protein